MPDRETVNHFVGCAHGDFTSVKAMLQKEPGLIEAESDQGEKPLQAAAHTGQTEIAEYLIQHGAELDVCTAAMLGQFETVANILTQSPELAHATGAHGLPIMYYPALKGHVGILELLLEKNADINAGDGISTSLHGAVLGGSADAAKWLVSHGARADTKDYAGRTPIEAANLMQRTEVAEALSQSLAPQQS